MNALHRLRTDVRRRIAEGRGRVAAVARRLVERGLIPVRWALARLRGVVHVVLNAGSAMRIAGRAMRIGVIRWWEGLVRFWASVRPSTRRGAVVGSLVVISAAATIAVVLFVGAMVLWSPYVESAMRPDADAQAWAALDPQYAGGLSCQACHSTEVAKAATASHAGLACESCHGAQLAHAVASPETPEISGVMAVPGQELCITCHLATAGRPATVRQVNVAEHYVPECLQCHDPHTAISRRPPVVLHPLESLPPCVTCHGPDGFKARSQRHPVVADDELCLSCHAQGRGPGVDDD